MTGERLDMTKKELTALARKRGLKGYSTMTKAELESALGLDTMVFQGEEAPEKAKGAKAKKSAAPAKTEVPADPQEGEKAKAPEAAPKLGKDQPVAEKKVPAAATDEPAAAADEPAEAEADDKELVEAVGGDDVEAVDAVEETEAAAESEAPQGPPLKKTWTNHELLIDEEIPQALPGGYNRDRAVLLVRDPFWVYGYWDLTQESVARAQQEGGVRLTLRVHDVTDVIFNGTNSHYSFDIPMPFEGQRVWYFNVPTDGRTYLYQVGYLRADKRFLPLVTSNVGATPRSRMSDVIADRFMSIDYERPLEEAVRPTGGAPTQAPTPTPAAPGFVQENVPAERPSNDISVQMYQESLRGTPYWSADIPKYGDMRGMRGLSSASLSSWAVPSSAEFAPKPAAEGKTKDFWLVADCELIVYGATEPDAKVTVRGQAIQLRPDGSFTLRFALPNGIHPIPIHAVNADGDMERGITITVSRDTQVDQ